MSRDTVRDSRGSLDGAFPLTTWVRSDLNEILRDVIGNCQPLLVDAEIALAVEMTSNLPGIMADREALAAVLFALVVRGQHSIAKAEQHNGMIRLKTWAQHDSVYLSLADNGLGATSGDEHQYVGMGLTECAEIIADHGGRMFSWRTYVGDSTYTLELSGIRQGPATSG